MAELNEDLKKIREAEENVTKMIMEETEKFNRRVEEAKKQAEEIIKNAENELIKFRTEMENKVKDDLELEEKRLREEWNKKIEKLKNINIDDEIIKNLAKEILEVK